MGLFSHFEFFMKKNISHSVLGSFIRRPTVAKLLKIVVVVQIDQDIFLAPFFFSDMTINRTQR